jgi:hypothetical protein
MSALLQAEARRFFSAPAWLVLLGALLSASVAPALAQTAQAPLPVISNVRIDTPAAVTFEKFQIEFDVATVAQNFFVPYDAAPPRGVTPGIGITVDALFSHDHWQTTIVQPAFWYQPYTYSLRGGRDHFVPNGAPRWMVRFAPQVAGAWQFRLRARDRGGETLSPAYDFKILPGAGGRYDGLRLSPYSQHGFIRVSKNDARYFEFQDGTPFYGLGYNSAFNNLASATNQLRAWQLNGIQFVRVWMSSASINASQWTSWSFPKQPQRNGMPFVPIDPTHALPGRDFSLRIDDAHPCLFTDFWQGPLPVLPNTSYTVSAQVRLDNVRASASDGGFVIKPGDWADSCASVPGKPLNAPLVGTTDWITVTGKLTTTNQQYWLPYLWFQRDRAAGTIFMDNVRLYASNDPAQVNLLREPQADSEMYFDEMNSAKWDNFIQAAEQYGVYLKLVTDEKNEWIRNLIQRDGSIGAAPDNNNFYAAPNTRVRWLDQAWWRYLIARWGYSTAIHSFEFINEGDPYNSNHYDAANAMAQYFHANDPSHHMVTTSFWHSFPNKEFWSNPQYAQMDYADLHAYITTGWGDDASFIPRANLETRPAYVRSAPASFRVPLTQTLNRAINPRGITLAEKGEWTIRYWMKGENIKATCPQNASRVRIMWTLDGGAQNGGAQGNVPADAKGQLSACASPTGSFDWTRFSSQRDRSGNLVSLAARLVIADTLPHELNLFVANERGTGGTAWIDNVELVSPSGNVVPVLGGFDPASFTSDTAWYTAAYSELFGGSSPVGAHKPLVRGESGIDSAEFPNGLLKLNQDQQGIWLHNMVWGQINSGGMYDLLWWANTTIENNPNAGRKGALWSQYLTFYNFIRDVPLNNGNYRDAQATTSDPRLRAWGQRDDVNGRAHLWIQNTLHQWDNVIAGAVIPPLRGTVTLAKMRAGTYRIDWWNPYLTENPITLSQTVRVTDLLTLTLPTALTSDIAVKIQRLPN